MPINLIVPPEGARRAALSVIHHVARGQHSSALKLQEGADLAFTLSLPMRVAFLPLDKISPDISLREAAKSVALRFLVGQDAGPPIASLQVTMARGDDYRLDEISFGPSVEGAYIAYQRAAAMPMFEALPYEATLLFSPAVHVVGLWLQGGEHRADRILPIPPTDESFTHYDPIEQGAFMERLSRLARKVPLNDSVRGG